MSRLEPGFVPARLGLMPFFCNFAARRLSRLLTLFYEASYTDALDHHRQIRSFLLDIYSIRLIPLIKEGELVPASYKLYLLEKAHRCKLVECIDRARDIALELIDRHLDHEVRAIALYKRYALADRFTLAPRVGQEDDRRSARRYLRSIVGYGSRRSASCSRRSSRYRPWLLV